MLQSVHSKAEICRACQGRGLACLAGALMHKLLKEMRYLLHLPCSSKTWKHQCQQLLSRVHHGQASSWLAQQRQCTRLPWARYAASARPFSPCVFDQRRRRRAAPGPVLEDWKASVGYGSCSKQVRQAWSRLLKGLSKHARPLTRMRQRHRK